jgi:hypothetical protein
MIEGPSGKKLGCEEGERIGDRLGDFDGLRRGEALRAFETGEAEGAKVKSFNMSTMLQLGTLPWHVNPLTQSESSKQCVSRLHVSSAKLHRIAQNSERLKEERG